MAQELLIALIAAGAALSGSLLGSFLTRTTEHRQWLRDERQQLYKAFIDTYQQRDRAVTESESRRWEVTDSLDNWPAFPSHEYILICPKDTADSILQTVNLLVLLRQDIAEGKPPERLAKRRTEARRIYSIAVTKMKRDLGT